VFVTVQWRAGIRTFGYGGITGVSGSAPFFGARARASRESHVINGRQGLWRLASRGASKSPLPSAF
jgi:hypothetical protein